MITSLLLAQCGSPDTGNSASAIGGSEAGANAAADAAADARAASGDAAAEADAGATAEGGADSPSDAGGRQRLDFGGVTLAGAVADARADGPALDAGLGCGTPDASPSNPPVCGDGFRSPWEECDDGLKTSATRRGCSAQCQVLDELAVAPPVDGGLSTVARTLGSGRHAVAVSDSTFAVAYLEQDVAPPVLSLAAFTSQAVPATPVTTLSTASTVPLGANPVVAGLPCNTYVTAWTDYGGDGDGLGVAMQVVQPGVAVAGPPQFANTTTMFSQFDPDIVWTGSQVVVAWVDDSDEATQPDLRLRVFDSTNDALSGEQTLAATADSEADVALAAFAGSWAAAWRDDANGLETVRVHTGTTDWSVGPAFLPAPVATKPALVQLDATHLLVAYAVGIAPTGDAGGLPALTSKIQLAVLDMAAPAKPTIVAVPATVPSAIGLSQSQPDVVSVEGSLFLAWWTEAALGDPNGEELWLKPIAWNGTALTTTAPEIALPRLSQSRAGDQRHPAMAASTLPPGGALVLGWDDLGGAIGGGEAAGDIAVELVPVPLLRSTSTAAHLVLSGNTAFGGVANGTSVTHSFTLSNSGNVPTGAVTLTLNDAFLPVTYDIVGDTCSGAVLVPSAGCTFGIRFTPGTSNEQTQQATIFASAPATAQSPATSAGPLTLTGEGVPGVQLWINGSGNFGTANDGTSVSQSFTVNNAGTATMTGSLSVSVGGSAAFVMTSNTCNSVSLGPGASCNVTVKFAPTSPMSGALVGTLTATSTSVADGSTSIPLNGVAVGPPAQLVLTQASPAFGSVADGQTATELFALTNTGTQPSGSVVITLGTTQWFGVSSNCPSTLAASASCTITVTFSPPPNDSGLQTTTLTASASPGGTATSAISATAVSTVTLVSNNPLLPFGMSDVGASESGQFTITNTGNSFSGPLVLSLSGATDFTILDSVFGSSACSTATLAPGGSCTTAVAYTPTIHGPVSATWTATDGTHSVSVAVSGIGMDPQPYLITVPQTLNMNTNSTNSIQWELVNYGNSTAPVTRITTNCDAEFITDDSTCPASFAPGQSCSVTLQVQSFGVGLAESCQLFVCSGPTCTQLLVPGYGGIQASPGG
jgi:cysteine-rich repeat protein